MKLKAMQICNIYNCLVDLGNERVDGKTASKISLLITDKMERIREACVAGEKKIHEEFQVMNEKTKTMEIPLELHSKYNEQMSKILEEEHEIEDPEKLIINTETNPKFIFTGNKARILKDFIEIK